MTCKFGRTPVASANPICAALRQNRAAHAAAGRHFEERGYIVVRFAAAAERWFAKPVIAINATTGWHALRATQIADQVWGFGVLLEDY